MIREFYDQEEQTVFYYIRNKYEKFMKGGERGGELDEEEKKSY